MPCLKTVSTLRMSEIIAAGLPAPVHQALALKARAAGNSLNAYCAEKLATL